MPIRSQRLPMRFEDWELLPYQPGWKYEYWGGSAHITPNHQTAVTVAPVTPRPVTAPCVIRPVRSDDETPLLTVYLAAFADNQAFCDYTDEKMHDAARRDLRESFTGRRAPLLAAARVAVAADMPDAPLVGAALLSRDREYGPVLDLLFIHPTWHRRGLAGARRQRHERLASGRRTDLDERVPAGQSHQPDVASRFWFRGTPRPALRPGILSLRPARAVPA